MASPSPEARALDPARVRSSPRYRCISKTGTGKVCLTEKGVSTSSYVCYRTEEKAPLQPLCCSLKCQTPSKVSVGNLLKKAKRAESPPHTGRCSLRFLLNKISPELFRPKALCIVVKFYIYKVSCNLDELIQSRQQDCSRSLTPSLKSKCFPLLWHEWFMSLL